jgi:hypothetical protein
MKKHWPKNPAQDAGYQAIRYEYDMVRPDLENIPDLPLPAGLEVRPVLPSTTARSSMPRTRPSCIIGAILSEPEESFQKMQVEPIFDPSCVAAWDGDQIAGMVLSFINKAENEEFKMKRGYTKTSASCARIASRGWRRPSSL